MIVLKKVKVSGKVQGVFFRASTQRKAEELGVKGWVKNEKDGTVIMEAEALQETLSTFIEWCNHGPSGARVDKVEVSDGELKNYTSFEIKR
jgi:acylphosphatase